MQSHTGVSINNTQEQKTIKILLAIRNQPRTPQARTAYYGQPIRRGLNNTRKETRTPPCVGNSRAKDEATNPDYLETIF